MGLASYNRMRRFKAIADGVGTDVSLAPAAGLNTRETISEVLKASHVPHSLDESKALARIQREAARAAQSHYAKFADPELQRRHDEQNGRVPPNTRELATRVERAHDAPASIKLDETGQPGTKRRDDPPLVSLHSATHSSPPTSIHPGTEGHEPEVLEIEGRTNSALGDGKPSTEPPNPRALGVERPRTSKKERAEQKDAEAAAAKAEKEERDRAIAEEQERNAAAGANAAMGSGLKPGDVPEHTQKPPAGPTGDKATDRAAEAKPTAAERKGAAAAEATAKQAVKPASTKRGGGKG
jgi:hypothetical protein